MEHWVDFPVLCGQPWLVIYFINSNVYVLVPTSCLSLAHHFPFGNQKFLFKIHESLSVFVNKFICIIFYNYIVFWQGEMKVGAESEATGKKRGLQRCTAGSDEGKVFESLTQAEVHCLQEAQGGSPRWYRWPDFHKQVRLWIHLDGPPWCLGPQPPTAETWHSHL